MKEPGTVRLVRGESRFGPQMAGTVGVRVLQDAVRSWTAFGTTVACGPGWFVVNAEVGAPEVRGRRPAAAAGDRNRCRPVGFVGWVAMVTSIPNSGCIRVRRYWLEPERALTLQPGPVPGHTQAGPRSPAKPLGDWFRVTEDLGKRLAAHSVSDGYLSSSQPRVLNPGTKRSPSSLRSTGHGSNRIRRKGGVCRPSC